MPVLEDATLAQRAEEGTLTVKDLLLYSAVCGTGLDTVPLPGDTTNEQITAILLDLSALALRLDKPLTARLDCLSRERKPVIRLPLILILCQQAKLWL